MTTEREFLDRAQSLVVTRSREEEKDAVMGNRMQPTRPGHKGDHDKDGQGRVPTVKDHKEQEGSKFRSTTDKHPLSLEGGT